MPFAMGLRSGRLSATGIDGSAGYTAIAWTGTEALKRASAPP